ncbi:hypothetical protein [Xanthomarina spongicola]|uniref:Uncharacterized protein n=1 Tax=Xanthomarina spongicola TaxID=570520 RepID=A0A316DJ31_9FLAO|nr:hypothetical protein [Xanthomarina spongicola]PWK18194.1 hypothetical protein LX78_02103 [Xanthomarina spongicola]
MKTLKSAMFIFLLIVFIKPSYSQDVVYSSIFKNVNKIAKSLNHDLNTSGDTLYLDSKFALNKIEIIGDSNLKEFAINDETKNLQIPLNDLPIGDYTFAVVLTEGHDDTYIYRKTIVFKVSRLIPIELGNQMEMNTLPTNMSLHGDQIAILDLSENKIIKKMKKPVHLASHIDETNKLSAISGNTISNNQTQAFDDLENIKTTNEIIKEKPIRFKAYNLTDIRYRNHNIQSREDYRRNNLRPNGRRYD